MKDPHRDLLKFILVGTIVFEIILIVIVKIAFSKNNITLFAVLSFLTWMIYGSIVLLKARKV